MGQRDAFSYLDIAKVNKRYKCTDKDLLDTHYPGILNNIDEIDEEITSSSSTTTQKSTTSTSSSSPTNTNTSTTQRPNRPNRPFLNLLGGMISQAWQQG